MELFGMRFRFDEGRILMDSFGKALGDHAHMGHIHVDRRGV